MWAAGTVTSLLSQDVLVGECPLQTRPKLVPSSPPPPPSAHMFQKLLAWQKVLMSNRPNKLPPLFRPSFVKEQLVFEWWCTCEPSWRLHLPPPPLSSTPSPPFPFLSSLLQTASCNIAEPAMSHELHLFLASLSCPSLDLPALVRRCRL